MSLRNKPCRCGSGLKTKKCCGEVRATCFEIDACLRIVADTARRAADQCATFNGTPIYKIHGSTWLRAVSELRAASERRLLHAITTSVGRSDAV